ncbi:MAG TPA: hypothetical protein VNJ12_13070 [Candidatus Dormibacteraeota bacterium]|nr:hypothetical protein [Candidatus Dormibacteraeota bacterium]
MSIHKQERWRAARYLVIAFAFGGWFTGTALAQTAVKNRASKTNSSETADPPASSSADLSSSGDPSAAPTGTNIGNYNVQGSLNMGWRYSNITGSQANYDTFVNLQQGPRLLGFSLNAYSLNHKGAYFDTMSVNGFGFGGDPVDVVRLNMTKNRWYDFAATYRRYKYFWGYNLLANPLNPSSSNPAIPVTTAAHLMDLSHRMSDFQLKLLPQSAVHLRLGYTHSREMGPSYTTTGAAVAPINEPGATALLLQNFQTTEDNYDIGIDFAFLPRTTLSYDQFVQHYKEDLSATDGNLNFQLPDGTPVDMGLVFYPGTPCGSPVSNGSTNPPTANPVCQGNLTYDRGGRPRGTIPTERFGFQSTYFRNLNMTGAISYSSGDQVVNDLYDSWTGVDTRINALGTNDTAKSKATRIIVNGDWNAIYDVTAKFRIMDSFNYNVFRIPGIYNFGVINYFGTGSGATLTAAENPILFNPTDCPAPYTATTCPQHSSGASADLANGYRSTYLGQDLRSNTFMLAYDFTRHVGAHIGYRYTKRKITDFAALNYTAETYDPGSTTTGAAAAYRGDCALSGTLPAGSTFPVYYPGTTTQRGICTVQTNGSVVFAGVDSSSDTSHNLSADINGNSALFGLWIRPMSKFRTSFDLELFSADQSFARITPRLLRHYQINSTYIPVGWADITGAIDIVDSSNDVTEVQNKEHNRSYGLSTTFMPAGRFSFDLSYNYNDVYTQAFDCFAASGATSGLPAGFSPVPTCPLVDPDGNASPVTIGALAAYQSKTNFASADMMVKPVKQVTFTLGYSGSFVRGTTTFFNYLSGLTANFTSALTPWGPLRFNYQMPYVTMNWNLYRGLSYMASWNYYGYNSRGNNNPTGLAPLGTQDFNGNNMTMSAQYSF